MQFIYNNYEKYKKNTFIVYINNRNYVLVTN